MSAAEATASVEEIVDLHGVGNHGNGKFSLGAVFSLHDLTDAQAAVMGRNVRLLTVSGRLNRGKGWRRLVLKGEMMKCGELHTIVKVLRTKPRRMRRSSQRSVVGSWRGRLV